MARAGISVTLTSTDRATKNAGVPHSDRRESVENDVSNLARPPSVLHLVGSASVPSEPPVWQACRTLRCEG